MASGGKRQSLQQLAQDKLNRVMNGIAAWTSFYRSNPHRFAKDFLNLDLKVFQKILIYAMNTNNFFMYLAARGQGKTFLIAVFCVIRCILYPGTKIVVTAGVKSQATEVIGKIKDDLMKLHQWGSSNLVNEIEEIKTGLNESSCTFANGSWIKVKTSNDNARSARANILIVDEFRMVSKSVVDTVLRRFLTAPRTPGYLSKPEYSHLIERNKEIYASSCWYGSHWMMKKIQSYFINMLKGKKYFVCSLPYQMSILEGLLSKEAVEDEMSEADFDALAFSMEMEALMYIDTEGSFFTYDVLSKRRKIKQCFYPLELYSSKGLTVPKLSPGEERILSVDIALMASSKKRKNDASSLWINSAIPISNTEFTSNFVYSQDYEGLTTDDLGIIVMRTFYEYRCTQLVLDTNGVGMGVFDFIIKDQYDSITGKTYKALSCCNDEEMAKRCKIKDAKKVVWSIKASASFNNEMCILLRSGIQNGRINFPVHELEGEDFLKKQFKNFHKFTTREQVLYKIAYIQTSYMINELINLEYEMKNGNVRIYEKPDARKDRYSSIGYNYWVINQIMRKRKPSNNNSDVASLLFSQTRKGSRRFKTFGN